MILMYFMKKKKKWDWKIFWIIILVILLAIVSYSYGNYQQEVQNMLSELELNLTREYANLDCYDRGTVECYDIGSVGEVEDELEEFLRTHDCYDRGYFANKFCYDEQCTTITCEAGYSLVCIQN